MIRGWSSLPLTALRSVRPGLVPEPESAEPSMQVFGPAVDKGRPMLAWRAVTQEQSLQLSFCLLRNAPRTTLLPCICLHLISKQLSWLVCEVNRCCLVQTEAPCMHGRMPRELSACHNERASSLYSSSSIGVPRHAAAELLHECLQSCLSTNRARPQLSKPQGWLWSDECCQVSHWLSTVCGVATLQWQEHPR